MGIISYRERVFKNKQKYLFSLREIKIKRIKSKADIGMKWYNYYDANGNFDKKKYYLDFFKKSDSKDRKVADPQYKPK